MSKDSVLSDKSVVDDLTTNDATVPLSAAQGRTLGLSVNTNKINLDKVVTFSGGDIIYQYVVGDINFKLRWIASPQQFGFEYTHAGADPNAELMFNYVSSKSGVLASNSHQATVNSSVGNRYFNPADLTLSNSDVALTANGHKAEVRGMFALSDETFTIHFYMSIFRGADYTPTLTSQACVCGWRWVSTP